jgi:tetratricopeptide (TPR) repeat protein
MNATDQLIWKPKHLPPARPYPERGDDLKLVVEAREALKHGQWDRAAMAMSETSFRGKVWSAEVTGMMAQVAIAAELWETALYAAERALVLDPLNRDATIICAQALHSLARTEEALAHVTSFLDEFPNDAGLLLEGARLACAVEDQATAESLLKLALATDPEGDIRSLVLANASFAPVWRVATEYEPVDDGTARCFAS